MQENRAPSQLVEVVSVWVAVLQISQLGIGLAAFELGGVNAANIGIKHRLEVAATGSAENLRNHARVAHVEVAGMQ